jgi:hypothetical protein
MSVHLDSEREVEMYFASPLFHGLGYTSEHEAAGFRFDMWEALPVDGPRPTWCTSNTVTIPSPTASH